MKTPAPMPLRGIALALLDRFGAIDERPLGRALAGGWRPGLMHNYSRVARDTIRRLEADGLIERGADGWYTRAVRPADPALPRLPTPSPLEASTRP